MHAPHDLHFSLSTWGTRTDSPSSTIAMASTLHAALQAEHDVQVDELHKSIITVGNYVVKICFRAFYRLVKIAEIGLAPVDIVNVVL